MKKRLVQSLLTTMFLLVIFQVAESDNRKEVLETNFVATKPTAGVSDIVPVIADLPVVENNEVEVVAEEVPEIELTELYQQYVKMGFSAENFYDDVALLEAIVSAEAGNQSEMGQRLVADVVLNRIDSDRWRDDDTIWEVIAHPGQFETYSNGAYTRVDIDESIGQIVEEEIISRTNYDVIYFRTGYYFSGVPALFQVGDHYFSGE